MLDDPSRADTEYDGAFGRTTVSATVDQFMGFDLVVHGWDLARATGQDEAVPPAEVDRVLAFVERLGTQTMQDNGVTGPEVAGAGRCAGAGPDARAARSRPALIRRLRLTTGSTQLRPRLPAVRGSAADASRRP